jgi:uncharacterized protein (DUF2147 family)
MRGCVAQDFFASLLRGRLQATEPAHLHSNRNPRTILPFCQPSMVRRKITNGMRAMGMGNGKRRIAGCLGVVAALVSTGIGKAQASHVDGTWRIRDLALNIFNCHDAVCGRIVWIGDPGRRPAQCGKTIVWGLKAEGPNQWAGGSILDPDDGNTYRLSATYETDGTLRARIFKGVPLLGRTEILRRVDVRKLTGRC